MMVYDYDIARVSLIGDRKLNQDRAFVIAQGGDLLLVVADGLGGHPRGEIAAQLLIDTCETRFRQAEKPLADPHQFIVDCVNQAHAAVVRFGDSQEPPLTPMTTAVFAILRADGVIWGHLGDSRLYLLRRGEFIDGTRDHTQVVQFMQAGSGNTYPRTVVTRCIGSRTNPVEVEYGAHDQLQINDQLLLCSDGFWGQLKDSDMLDGLSTSAPLATSLERLAERALKNGTPRSDNITAIVARKVRIPG